MRCYLAVFTALRFRLLHSIRGHGVHAFPHCWDLIPPSSHLPTGACQAWFVYLFAFTAPRLYTTTIYAQHYRLPLGRLHTYAGLRGGYYTPCTPSGWTHCLIVPPALHYRLPPAVTHHTPFSFAHGGIVDAAHAHTHCLRQVPPPPAHPTAAFFGTTAFGCPDTVRYPHTPTPLHILPLPWLFCWVGFVRCYACTHGLPTDDTLRSRGIYHATYLPADITPHATAHIYTHTACPLLPPAYGLHFLYRAWRTPFGPVATYVLHCPAVRLRSCLQHTRTAVCTALLPSPFGRLYVGLVYSLLPHAFTHHAPRCVTHCRYGCWLAHTTALPPHLYDIPLHTATHHTLPGRFTTCQFVTGRCLFSSWTYPVAYTLLPGATLPATRNHMVRFHLLLACLPFTHYPCIALWTPTALCT